MATPRKDELSGAKVVFDKFDERNEWSVFRGGNFYLPILIHLRLEVIVSMKNLPVDLPDFIVNAEVECWRSVQLESILSIGQCGKTAMLTIITVLEL